MYDAYFTLSGPAGTVEAPNETNPIDESLDCVLRRIADHVQRVHNGNLFRITGVRIEEHDDLVRNNTGDKDE